MCLFNRAAAVLNGFHSSAVASAWGCHGGGLNTDLYLTRFTQLTELTALQLTNSETQEASEAANQFLHFPYLLVEGEKFHCNKTRKCREEESFDIS